MAPRCDRCDKDAVWRWQAPGGPAEDLCDDHAASMDLDDLQELAYL
jgi:hypothetical protein